MKKRIPFQLPFLYLSLLAILLGYQAHQSSQYRHQLTEIYRGAALSAVRNMENMEHSLNKAMLSGEGTAAARYLTTASDQAGQARKSLSLLPLSHPDTMQAVKMTNQLSDYVQTLQKQNGITPYDARQLRELLSASREYAELLYNNEEMLIQPPREPLSFYPEQGTEALDDSLQYPTLIYDGPFSDARKEEPLPFEGEEISWEEAEQIARDCIGKERVLRTGHGTDTFGPNPCHGITLVLEDVTLEAAVTKKGGKVLWLTPDNAAFENLVTLEQCREEALSFLSRNGFPVMECTSFQIYEGVAVLAFAAVENNVLLYPDQVKVQLRMDNAQVVGLESKNFWQNHRARNALLPTLSAEEARASLPSRLQVSGNRLCVIPVNDRESLCWEFACSYDNQDYLLYINAENGQQEDLLQIVESAAGIETV